MKPDNRFVVMMMDRYTKLSKPTNTIKTNITKVSDIFLEHRVANYVTPTKFITENGPQL